MIGIGVGVGVYPRPPYPGGGGITPSLPSGSNPNLLVFPNDLTNGAWVKSAATVVGQLLTFTGSGGGFIYQATIAAATGNTSSLGFALPASPTRFSVSGTFNGLPYTLSVVLSSSTNVGDTILVTIYRSGGLLRAQLADGDGTNPAFTYGDLKLEQSSSFSGYP